MSPSPDQKETNPKTDNLFLDCGARSKKEVEELGIHIGAVVTYVDGFEELAYGNWIARAFDNRIGGFMIAEVGRMLKKDKQSLPFTLHIVNAVQEEIGLRGAEMIARRLKPDVAIVTDVTHDTTTPRLFLIPSTTVTATDTRIPWPCYSDQVDYEVELAVFIGKAVRCTPPEEALDYVAGYSIANDISARSVTFKSGRAERPWDEFYDWLCGKWADGFLPLGPCLVTTDELGNPQNLDMELKVNGKTRQKANTADMIFSVAEIVSFISHIMTLEPGDCIATGTPEGVGAATGEFLQAGDRIECKIEKIGTLTNIMDEPPAPLYKPLEKK